MTSEFACPMPETSRHSLGNSLKEQPVGLNNFQLHSDTDRHSRIGRGGVQGRPSTNLCACCFSVFLLFFMGDFASTQSPPGIVGSTLVARLERFRDPAYAWVNNDEVVEWVADQSPQAFRVRPQENGPNPDFVLNDRLSEDAGSFIKGGLSMFLGGVLPSPDGQMILLSEAKFSYGITKWHVVNVTGANAHSFGRAPLPFIGAPVWSQNSDSLYALEQSAEATYIVRWDVKEPAELDTSRPTYIKILDLMRPRRSVMGQTVTSMTSEATLAGITAGGDGVIIDWKRYTSGDISAYQVDAITGKRPTRKFKLHAPNSGRINEVVLSTAADKIAYCVYNTDINKGKHSERPISAHEIWISNLDGSGLHMIGRKHVNTPGSEERLSEAPRLLRWTPDGKRVSYVLDNALWTLPAKIYSSAKSSSIGPK